LSVPERHFKAIETVTLVSDKIEKLHVWSSNRCPLWDKMVKICQKPL